MDAETQSPRILFVRPDHIGDVLLTLPAVTALRRALPAAYLAYAAPASSAEVAGHCPHIDAALTVPFPSVGRPESNAIAWGATVRAQSVRLANAFDAALVVRPDDP